jgi:hypothetical protein
MRSWLSTVLPALLVLVGSTRAQTVTGPAIPIPRGTGVRPHGPRLFVVDDTPGCRFSADIQSAVDAASDGDVLLVRPGIYPSFVIDGKSVLVFGEVGPLGTEVRVAGLTIRNQSADQPVVVSGFHVPGRILTSAAAGPVWIERCRTDSYRSTFADTDIVGLFDSTIFGARVNGASTIVAYASSFDAPGGGDGYCDGFLGYCYPCYSVDGTNGGHGLELREAPSRGYFFGCDLSGGPPGNSFLDSCPCFGSCYTIGGAAGYGLYARTGTETTLVETMPSTIAGGGTVSTLPGTVGGYSAATAALSGAAVTLTFHGPPGWNVLLTYSREYEPEYVPERTGWTVVDPDSPTLFIGAMPLSGTLQIALPFHLAPGQRAAVLYTQAKLYDTVTGNGFLAEPSALLVYRDPCP